MDEPRTYSTVGTSLEIIEALEELELAGVTELSDYLDITKATVYTHLATLKDRKYVKKQNGKYHLSLKIFNIGSFVKNKNILYQAGKEEVNRLAQDTEEYVHLVTEEHEELIYLYDAKGENAVGEDYFKHKVEGSNHLHTSAYGKAMLAYFSEEKLEKIFGKDELVAKTQNTITDRDKIRRELNQIRKQGFALNDEEEILGTRAVGAPILDSEKNVLGAISITKPTSKMQGDHFKKEVPDTVRTSANLIEVNVQTLLKSDTQYLGL
ncbi:MAG: IclR family transcriptional regulator [Halobacteriaceae archaeon]